MHKHHDDCRHRHEHTLECKHGTPTARPRAGYSCPVCRNVAPSLLFCQVHREWECSQHVTLGVHHDVEKNVKARAEEIGRV
jgi:hypothetical protein